MLNIRDYCQRNSFWSLLMKTQKYKELIVGKEARCSLFFSLITIVSYFFLFDSVGYEKIEELTKNILVFLVPGLIGLLGFLVTGLTMMASIITSKAVKKIDEFKKAKSLAGILFSFYFEGFVVGLNIAAMIFSYIALAFPNLVNEYIFLAIIALISYIFWFSIIYAVALLGTCINFFFVNVYYTEFLDDTKANTRRRRFSRRYIR